MTFEECFWNIYDDDSRGFLGIGLYIIGICSVVLNCWLLATFAKTSLIGDRSYLTLLNLSIASTARSLLAGFLFSGMSAVAHRWMFGEASCKLFGFLHQFTSTYQIEALTHMCIERYVLAKYIKYGWEIRNSHYVLFTGLCWMFSILYSFPSLFGVGTYGLDYSCTACTLDLIFPADAWTKLFVVCVLLLVSIKPLFVMSTMLMWARQIEIKCYKEKDITMRNQLILTKSTMSVAWSAMCCWTPAAVVAAWSVVPQLMYDTVIQPPLALVVVASLCSEAAPGIIVIANFWSNKHIRSTMMSLLGETTYNKDS